MTVMYIYKFILLNNERELMSNRSSLLSLFLSPGDDDRPEIIELSEFNAADPRFAFCSPRKGREDGEQEDEEYRDQRQQYRFREVSGHEHDYRQLQYPEPNLSEGEGYNNEDSVSQVNFSDGDIPKMKMEEVRMNASGLGLADGHYSYINLHVGKFFMVSKTIAYNIYTPS